MNSAAESSPATPPPPNIALLGFSLECNRSAPITDRKAFTDALYLDAAGIHRELDRDQSGLPATLNGFCTEMDKAGKWNPVPILLAEAPPGGPVEHAFFQEMLATMRTALNKATCIDGVYLCEHGAGLSTELDDADGAVFEMVRDVVGPDVPIISTLDLHGHVTPSMQRAVDVMIAYRTNPHVDQRERGEEAAGVMKLMLAGMKTHSYLIKVPMISPAVSLLTSAGPYAELIDYGQSLARAPIINISILAGFAPADASTNGMSIVVTTDASVDKAYQLARATARHLAQRAWADRHRYTTQLTSLDQAVILCKEVLNDARKPAIILADVADNPGGGGRGNTVFILRRLLEEGIDTGTLGMMIDPALAAQAHDRGTGTLFRATFNHNDPIRFSEQYRVNVRVLKLNQGSCVGRRGVYAGRRVNLGLCALLQIEGLQVVVASARHQCADPVFLERMGVDLSRLRVLVVKSRGHFRAGFDEYFAAEQVFEIDAPGLTTPVIRQLGLTQVPRPIYPLDPEMQWLVPE